MEIGAYANAVVQGVPLLFVVIGLVEWAKSFGLGGKALRAVSAGIGLILGGAYQVSVLGVPADFAGWFGIVFYGLGLGVTASGVYDAGASLITKIIKTPG